PGAGAGRLLRGGAARPQVRLGPLPPRRLFLRPPRVPQGPPRLRRGRPTGAGQRRHPGRPRLRPPPGGDLRGRVGQPGAALRVNPAHAVAHNVRGVVLVDRGDYAAAVAAYDKALQHAPKNPLFWVNRAEARRLNKDADGALADLGEALRLNPQFAAAFYT